MQIIQHRVNTMEQLSATPTQYGVELDLRDKYDEIVIEHDAFNKGENWEVYLQNYHHGLMIANVKTEGIEKKIIADLEKAAIDNYFLLDVSLPFMVKLSKAGFKKMAIRFSEYEPLELAMQFMNKVEWLWVDYFTRFPLTQSSYDLLHKHFKICIVSPELQGHSLDIVKDLRQQINGMHIDAVCTKQPSLWL